MPDATTSELPPRRALSLGAGVQSTTLFLMALAGEVEPFDIAVFADTGAEPVEVYEHLAKLQEEGDRKGCPIEVVTASGEATGSLLTERMLDPTRRDGIQIPVFIRGAEQPAPSAWATCERCGGSGDYVVDEADAAALEDLAEKYPTIFDDDPGCPGCEGSGRVATEWNATTRNADGMLRRQCTERFKSRPVYKFLNAWRDGAPVVQALGISWDEVGRMKPAQRKWVTNEYPLIDGRRDRRWCHERLAAFGWTAPRSACVYCPYHSDAEWRHLRDNAPEDFAEAIRVDHAMRAVHAERMATGATSMTGTPFLHRSLLPIDEVDFRTEEDRGQGSLFGEECEGLCGI